jgi:hypothetical protein
VPALPHALLRLAFAAVAVIAIGYGLSVAAGNDGFSAVSFFGYSAVAWRAAILLPPIALAAFAVLEVGNRLRARRTPAAEAAPVPA